MPAARFVEALNEQIGNEFSASQSYAAMAVHYDGETLPQLAAFFYRQSVEERNHAMMMAQYLLDAGAEITIPGIEPPRTQFADIVEPVTAALEQEKRVSDQIERLAQIAREQNDFTSEQFIQWFLKEQVEEVATMSALHAVAQRSRDNAMLVEDFIAREHSGRQDTDPTAPPVAGGAL
jgi:bacterioferritin B